MTSLFDRLPRLPDAKLHPLFREARDRRAHIAARGFMDRVFSEYVDKDGSFAREFQTQGFSARIWELSVFGYLAEHSYVLDNTQASPDFIIPGGCTIEAVTNQPGDPMSEPEMEHLKTREGWQRHLTINPADRIVEFQNQLRKAITSKLRKRFSNGLAYWELPHVRELPFVLAVQSFYAETSTAFTDMIAVAYLLGGTPGTPGLFDDPEFNQLSAVLFSNSGTIAQFDRMGKQYGYGAEDVRIWRNGFCYDPDPAAVLPREFGYEVGSPEAPPEHFGQSLHLIHNPNADRPLLTGILDGIRRSMRSQDGEIITTAVDGFLPLASFTLILEIT
jgi:hypothetical protein